MKDFKLAQSVGKIQHCQEGKLYKINNPYRVAARMRRDAEKVLKITPNKDRSRELY